MFEKKPSLIIYLNMQVLKGRLFTVKTYGCKNKQKKYITELFTKKMMRYRFNWQSNKINRQVCGKKAPYAVFRLMYYE